MIKSILLTLILVGSPLVFGQVGIELDNHNNTSSSHTCHCSPSCSSLEGDFDCKHGRIIAREDCPCCKVCLRQEGESCGGPDSPCDIKQGLTCSETKGVCEAPPPSSNSNTSPGKVDRIKSCLVDSDCPSDRFCVKDVCADPCSLLQPCLGAMKGMECLAKDHQPHCDCPKGTVPNHEVNMCLQVEENSSPSLVSLPSNAGCKVDEGFKSIGETYYARGCKQRCVCGEDGKPACDVLTCPHGLFPVGSSDNKRFCIEIRNTPLADECCVVLACSSNALQSIHPTLPKDASDSHLEKSPLRALTGRKIAPEAGQFLSEFDYQQKLEELESHLSGNVTLIKDDDHLQKDKKDLLKRLPFTDKSALVIKKEEEEKTTHKPMQVDRTANLNTPTPSLVEESKEKEMIPSTEATTSSTTFLLQSHVDEPTPEGQAGSTAEATTMPSETTSSLPLSLSSSSPAMNETETETTTMSLTMTTPPPAAILTNDTQTSPIAIEEETTQLPTEPEEMEPITELPTLPIENETPAPQPPQPSPTTLKTPTEPLETTQLELEPSTELPEPSLTTMVTLNTEQEDVSKHDQDQGKDRQEEPSEEDGTAGMIMEVAEDGKPLHVVSLVNGMTRNETFREEKSSSEGGFKPALISDKDHKTLMMQQDKFHSKPGMLQVKTATHNSTTLYLPSKAGGVLHYKESRAAIDAMKLTVDEGQEEVTVTGLSPDTRYTFKWAGAGGEESKGKIEVKTEDGCRHIGLSYPVGARWHEGCQTTCKCLPEGVSDCNARCLYIAGDIQAEQCAEVPSASDPECCVEYDCEKTDNSVLDPLPPSESGLPPPGGEPKLIVTSRTHNSVTVAWDDFRADNPDRGYVTEYREVPHVEVALRAKIPWMRKETLRGQPPPTMTIANLKPNTLYEVRVGIYSQAEERRLSAATETITVRTEPGCVYSNTSFPVGEFFQGCEERCSCSSDGSVKCSGRCTIPYFKKGSFANDSLCLEEKEEDGDECCVLVLCSHGGTRGNGDYDQCANTVCGKNAECVSWPTLTEAAGDQELPQPGSCRCKEGYSGDPKDHVTGCSADPAVADDSNNCMFRGVSYSPGDVFYDGCSYKCACSHQKEIECKARCQYAADETQEDTHNSCFYEPDPNDDCCKVRVCNSTSDARLDEGASPALDFDGCTFGNKTYAKNEEFTSGCESKCLCMGFGDISCFPRCPPVKELTHKVGVICETLLDPEDKCCNVTVCANTAPEVMKENVTDELMTMNHNVTVVMENDENENRTMIIFRDEMMHEKMNETMTEEMNKTMTEKMDKTMTEKMDKTMMEEMDKTMTETMNETVSEMEDKHMSEHMNETVMEHHDMMHMHKEDEAMIKMHMNETDMKNMTSGEDMEGTLSATVTEEMESGMTNATDEMKSMNETTPFVLFEKDTMTKHENETQEEDAVLINVEEHMLLTGEDRMENDTLTDDMSMKEMEAEMDDMNGTTSSRSFNEDVMFDRTGKPNESNTLMKKPRSDDIMIPSLEVGEIVPIDSSTVKMNVKVTQDILTQLLSSKDEHMIVSYSHDSLVWTNKTIPVDEIGVENMYDVTFHVPDLEAYDAYQFKVYYKDMVSPTTKASLANAPVLSNPTIIVPHAEMCVFEGRQYKALDNFYDGCYQYCQCTEDMKVICHKIECPQMFGLDIIDPGCLEWEDDHSYVGTPPSCCGEKPKCALHIDQLSCTHGGQTFQHLDFISQELVGCDQRCQCLSGNLDCEPLCNPVSATPPFHLHCESHVRLVTVAPYPCCREWQCSNETDPEFDFGVHPDAMPELHPTIHTGLPTAPQPELSLVDVNDITENSVIIYFTIASAFVGLPGGIYLRYTPDALSNPNPLHWDSEIIHEDGVILSHENWEYTKRDLSPGTNYTMQLALFTHLKRTEIVSPTFAVATRMEVTTPLPRLDLDAELSVSDIQNTSAKISWKHFTDHELQYIDGIRVRFWPGNKKFPLEGPMLYREADSMILRDLLPDSKYTVDLFFIPHFSSFHTSTISNTKNITFKTLPKPKGDLFTDKYAFNITIEAGKMSQEGVQILYSGVAEPEGKFVNVYRVVYTTDGDSQDSQKFKVPKNQKEGFIMLTDLKPGVQYEVWLEAYLTNGSKKKSNVITIKTKPGQLPIPEKSEVVEAKELETKQEGNYYSAFVAVAILVAIACLVILGLVFILFRRINHAKAHINSPKSNAAYDNPSYKTNDNAQNYAMELNGLKNTTNGGSRPEEP